jgi:hypothetical protein
MNEVKITSRKKWFTVALLITLVNPIFSGLIIGSAFLTEPELKKEGKIIIVLAVLWGVAVMFISRWLFQQGYFNV